MKITNEPVKASLASLTTLVKEFEDAEKRRTSSSRRLTHLAKNRWCKDCEKNFIPRSFELCPICHSENSRLAKDGKTRTCLDCQEKWIFSGDESCPSCGGVNHISAPRDDLYLRQVILPRQIAEEEFYEKELRGVLAAHPIWPWVERVKGAGLTSVGRIIGKTDISRCRNVSKFWAHCGWGLNPDGTPQRKIAGQKINYDDKLQSNCAILGECLLRQKGVFYRYYLAEKQRAVAAGCDQGHSHNRAFRHTIKIFLSLLWEVWRKAEGLEAPEPYAFAILQGHTGRIRPEEMTDK